MFLSVLVERDSVWGCAPLAVASRITAASADLLRAAMLGAGAGVNAYFRRQDCTQASVDCQFASLPIP